MRQHNAHRGFTLVELLVVIIVLGILGSAFALGFNEMESSAQATQIISNLTHLKTAVNHWLVDNDGLIEYTGDKNKGYTINGDMSISQYLHKHPDEIARYISNNIEFNSVGGYSVDMDKTNNVLMVAYHISDKASEHKRLREKLVTRARSAGLFSYTQGKEPKQYDGEDFVFMKVVDMNLNNGALK